MQTKKVEMKNSLIHKHIFFNNKILLNKRETLIVNYALYFCFISIFLSKSIRLIFQKNKSKFVMVLIVIHMS